ncbi:hypothetical protein NKDENANG_03071 [Candidatus Entotheonellaceae bacterium PAL068K]
MLRALRDMEAKGVKKVRLDVGGGMHSYELAQWRAMVNVPLDIPRGCWMMASLISSFARTGPAATAVDPGLTVTSAAG